MSPQNQVNDELAGMSSPALEDAGPIGTSTPKLQETRDRGPLDTGAPASAGLGVTYEPISAEEADTRDSQIHSLPLLERTPLLTGASNDLENGEREESEQNRQLKRAPFARWTIFLVLVSLLLIFLIVVWLVVRNIELLLNASIVPEIDAVSILNVTEAGVAAHVVGKVAVDYDSIDNWVYRSVLKMSAVLVGPVVVSSTKTVKAYISSTNFDSVHVVDILPPEMVLDLVNKRISPIDFISDTKLVDPGVQIVLDSVLAHNNSTIPLNIDLLFTPYVSTRWTKYKGKQMSITHHLELLPNDTHIPINVTEISTDFGRNFVTLSVNASLEPMPLELYVKPIEWDISLLNCDGDPSLLGVWTSENIQFQPDVPTIVELSGLVTNVPPELLQTCSDGLSPFNRFTKEVFEDSLVHVWVSATKSKKNAANLMPWMYKSLTLVTVEISAPIPEAKDLLFDNLISDYTVNLLDVVCPLTKDTDDLLLRVDIDASAVLNLPTKNDGPELNATKIQSQLSVWLTDGNDKILKARVDDGQAQIRSACLKGCLNTVNCVFNDVKMTILSPELIGNAVSRVLNGRNLPRYRWLTEVEQAIIDLSLFSTKLVNLRFENRQAHGIAIGDQNDTDLFLNHLIASANILIDLVTYISSSPSNLTLLVDFEITNPVNASFDTLHTISFDYFYNHTRIGRVYVEDFKIRRLQERQGFYATVEIESQSAYSSELLSHIVSGVPLVLNLQGSQGTLPFDKLLENVSIQKLNVPALSFNLPKSQSEIMEDDHDLKVSHSPFLISTVIHIWTSEIELTVYNPLANAEIAVRINQCQALYKGEMLAFIEKSDLILVPPGVYVTPRIPIQISKGLGADILRKALNGELEVDVLADLTALIGKFASDLTYQGHGLTATVKL